MRRSNEEGYPACDTHVETLEALRRLPFGRSPVFSWECSCGEEGGPGTLFIQTSTPGYAEIMVGAADGSLQPIYLSTGPGGTVLPLLEVGSLSVRIVAAEQAGAGRALVHWSPGIPVPRTIDQAPRLILFTPVTTTGGTPTGSTGLLTVPFWCRSVWPDISPITAGGGTVSSISVTVADPRGSKVYTTTTGTSGFAPVPVDGAGQVNITLITTATLSGYLAMTWLLQ